MISKVADFYKKNQPYVFGTVKNSTIQIAQAANKNIDFSKLDMNTIDKNAAAIGATDFDDAAALIKLLTAGLKSPQSITFAQNAVNSLYKSTTIAEFNASIMTIQGTLNSKTITNAADLATLQPFIATFYYSANFWAIPTR